MDLLGERTAQLAAAKHCVVELDRIRVKGKSEETRISTVVPETDAGEAAIPQAVLDDLYSGGLTPSDERLTTLAEKLPALASYYRKLKSRLEELPG